MSRERFNYTFDAMTKLDYKLFNATDDKEENVIDAKFKFPTYFLATGTSIKIPIVNEIKENEIALNIAVLLA